MRTFAFEGPFLHIDSRSLRLCWYKGAYNPGWISFYVFIIIMYFFSSDLKSNENENIFMDHWRHHGPWAPCFLCLMEKLAPSVGTGTQLTFVQREDNLGEGTKCKWEMPQGYSFPQIKALTVFFFRHSFVAGSPAVFSSWGWGSLGGALNPFPALLALFLALCALSEPCALGLCSRMNSPLLYCLSLHLKPCTPRITSSYSDLYLRSFPPCTDMTQQDCLWDPPLWVSSSLLLPFQLCHFTIWNPLNFPLLQACLSIYLRVILDSISFLISTK